ncbi:MAG: hypothetical protein ACQERC_01860 [Bacteroidota bacterium]
MIFNIKPWSYYVLILAGIFLIIAGVASDIELLARMDYAKILVGTIMIIFGGVHLLKKKRK